MSADPSLLQAALIGYQHQRDQIDLKIAEIREQLSGKATGVMPTATGATGTSAKRVVSAAARKRMAAGQRKRWAAAKGTTANEPVEAATQRVPKKRKMSAAGRKRIADATKKRWAEFRAKKAAASSEA